MLQRPKTLGYYVSLLFLFIACGLVFAFHYWAALTLAQDTQRGALRAKAAILSEVLDSVANHSREVLDNTSVPSVCNDGSLELLERIQRQFVIPSVVSFLTVNDEKEYCVYPDAATSVSNLMANDVGRQYIDAPEDYRIWFEETGMRSSDDMYALSAMVIQKGRMQLRFDLTLLSNLINGETPSYNTRPSLSIHVVSQYWGLTPANFNELVGEFIWVIDHASQYDISVVIGQPIVLTQELAIQMIKQTWFVSVLVFLLLCRLSYRAFERRYHALPRVLKYHFKHNTITPYYQPIINTASNRCIGAEVLCRGEGMSPSIFIPQVEDAGLELELTRYLLNRALNELSGWLIADRHRYLSLNVSASALMQSDFCALFEEERATHFLLARQLRLELTERRAIPSAVLTPILKRFRKLGYLIYLDDFGVEHSNLSNLQTLPIDALKVDKRFIDAIPLPLYDHHRAQACVSDDMSLVKQIADVASALNVDIIAEGVEHAYQKVYLNQMGIFLMQGWHFSPALSADDFVDFSKVKAEI
ncbi:EAL domain-containing protein [Vibrio algivorus]|uniref:EAL domain-containing protein n=1 Tax=Vibrio algivorus TaxID=1667024 RepID=A0A557PGY0_9VIBR|nr:EAL domain-containing protein [Vibrio algivorus]TVO39916.1 EAL domain-containing protein [Vibrio algivorus]